MRNVFLPTKISDNPARPFSSAPAYNQITPAGMVRRPYVNRLRWLPYPERGAAWASTDAQDQILFHYQEYCCCNFPGMNPMPVHLNPWRFPLRNAGGCAYASQPVPPPAVTAD